ncbi:MAG: hypothetical protein HYU59_01660 [Magnetospirillum gryphiswaldense]|nr:hypothetical protein [Magnetospirillum gryphiswaldense]
MRHLLLAGLAILVPFAAAADEFDIDKYEKKAFTFNGSAETKLEHLRFDRSAALYATSFWNQPRKQDDQRATETVDLEGKYTLKDLTLAARTETVLRHDYSGNSERTVLQEGYASYQAGTGVTLELGKRVLRWGKGYAWNPIGFVERSKDPSDPELSREGFVMAVADAIKSFDGPVKTVALTGVVVPVEADINDDYGRDDNMNLAAKLYLLAWDTDIDFAVLGRGSRTPRYGIDFSRNLSSNFEIHGEAAYIRDNSRKFTDSTQTVKTATADSRQYLLGLRYLTETDLTIIAEYFHNGGGVREGEMSAFADLAQAGLDAYDATGSSTLIQRAVNLAESGYAKPTPGTDYGYVKLSQKDAFGWLYVTPAVATIVNLRDRSFQLIPEVTYTGIENLDLRLRGTFLAGDDGDEFGEKANRWKAELTAKLYF